MEKMQKTLEKHQKSIDNLFEGLNDMRNAPP
jgi:hypothetical protein